MERKRKRTSASSKRGKLDSDTADRETRSRSSRSKKLKRETRKTKKREWALIERALCRIRCDLDEIWARENLGDGIPSSLYAAACAYIDYESNQQAPRQLSHELMALSWGAVLNVQRAATEKGAWRPENEQERYARLMSIVRRAAEIRRQVMPTDHWPLDGDETLPDAEQRVADEIGRLLNAPRRGTRKSTTILARDVYNLLAWDSAADVLPDTHGSLRGKIAALVVGPATENSD